MQVIDIAEAQAIIGGKWNAGFLLGITPLGTLGLAAGALVALLNNYGAYQQGVSEGYDRFNKNR